MTQRQGWQGVFYVTQGKTHRACNEIKPLGRDMTFNLWTGQVDEYFSILRLLDATYRAMVDKPAAFSRDGNILVSKVVFEGTDIDAAPRHVQLISTLGNVIAETDLPTDLVAGESIIVRREDSLGLNV